MSFPSLIVFAVLAFLLASLVGAVVLAYYDDGRILRALLAKRLAQTRMMRMLRRRGISSAAYLNSTPIVDIECHVENCARCPDTAQCDQVLASEGSTTDYSFCPNRNVMTLLGRAQHERHRAELAPRQVGATSAAPYQYRHISTTASESGAVCNSAPKTTTADPRDDVRSCATERRQERARSCG